MLFFHIPCYKVFSSLYTTSMDNCPSWVRDPSWGLFSSVDVPFSGTVEPEGRNLKNQESSHTQGIEPRTVLLTGINAAPPCRPGCAVVVKVALSLKAKRLIHGSIFELWLVAKRMRLQTLMSFLCTGPGLGLIKRKRKSEELWHTEESQCGASAAVVWVVAKEPGLPVEVV